MGICKVEDYDKRKSKWYTRIVKNGIVIHLGYFTDRALAIVKRREAEKEWYGKFAFRE